MFVLCTFCTNAWGMWIYRAELGHDVNSLFEMWAQDSDFLSQNFEIKVRILRIKAGILEKKGHNSDF